jgi:predicted PurR-regulated permease PerM
MANTPPDPPSSSPVVLPPADDDGQTDPAKRPPAWLSRALILTAVTAMAAVFTWNALHTLSTVLLMLLVALFVALAIEPPVNWLVRRGWKRGLATGSVIIGVMLLILAAVAAFGQMFVSQLIDLLDQIPETWEQVAEWLDQRFNIALPDPGSAVSTLTSQWGSTIASQAWAAGTALFSGIISLLGVVLIVYYLVARAPQFRAALCSPLPARQQRIVLQLWSIAEDKIAGYISSRVVLAVFSSLATWVVLFILKVPSALPLAVFTGLVSQFVPTVGTYVGGAAPVLMALLESPGKGLGVLIFIIAYQQVENLLLAPKISQRTMEINPAIAFVSVLGVGALMGPIGAFLALPLVATIQAIISTYVRRYTLVDDALLDQDA